VRKGFRTTSFSGPTIASLARSWERKTFISLQVTALRRIYKTFNNLFGERITPSWYPAPNGLYALDDHERRLEQGCHSQSLRNLSAPVTYASCGTTIHCLSCLSMAPATICATHSRRHTGLSASPLHRAPYRFLRRPRLHARREDDAVFKDGMFDDARARSH